MKNVFNSGEKKFKSNYLSDDGKWKYQAVKKGYVDFDNYIDNRKESSISNSFEKPNSIKVSNSQSAKNNGYSLKNNVVSLSDDFNEIKTLEKQNHSNDSQKNEISNGYTLDKDFNSNFDENKMSMYVDVNRVANAVRSIKKHLMKKTYLENRKFEVWDYVYGQSVDEAANMKYGIDKLSNNGCELIAVYNALFHLGDRKELSGIIYEAQKKDLFIGKTGIFGTNPYKISELLDLYGHKYSYSTNRSEFNSMLKPGGTYILSFWNESYLQGIHTVMFNMVSNNEIEIFNQYNSATSTGHSYRAGNYSPLDSYLDKQGSAIILYKVE